MKKVILAIVLTIATMAQAGMVGDTSVAYGKVKAEASVAGNSALGSSIDTMGRA